MPLLTAWLSPFLVYSPALQIWHTSSKHVLHALLLDRNYFDLLTCLFIRSPTLTKEGQTNFGKVEYNSVQDFTKSGLPQLMPLGVQHLYASKKFEIGVHLL